MRPFEAEQEEVLLEGSVLFGVSRPLASTSRPGSVCSCALPLLPMHHSVDTWCHIYHPPSPPPPALQRFVFAYSNTVQPKCVCVSRRVYVSVSPSPRSPLFYFIFLPLSLPPFTCTRFIAGLMYGEFRFLSLAPALSFLCLFSKPFATHPRCSSSPRLPLHLIRLSLYLVQ